MPPSATAIVCLATALVAATTVASQSSESKPTETVTPAESSDPDTPDLPQEIARLRIEVGEFTFDALAAGPETGELVLLLHGFPQTSYSFRHQLATLGRAGFRAVAPDQRGYSPDARPAEVEAYSLSKLIVDVTGIADALERESFHVVGHDWGAAVAWTVAAQHSKRVKTITALSTPHIAAFQAALADPKSEQTRRSAYFALFSAKGAERTFLANDARFLRSIFKGSGLRDHEIQVYVDALNTPEAMRAALNWYRAMMLDRRAPAANTPRPPKIQMPTLYIFSSADTAFSRTTAEATRDWVAGPYRFEVLEGISHWVPEQAAERVSQLILQHVRGK